MRRFGFLLALFPVLAAIGALTLFKSSISLDPFWNPAAHDQRSIDLIPFNGFVDPPIWYGPWTNTFGNILLFLPVGLLMALIIGRRRRAVLWATLLGLTISLVIEVTQYVLAVGYSDVDDLLTNTLGAFLGAWLSTKLSPSWNRLLAWSAAAGATIILVIMAAAAAS